MQQPTRQDTLRDRLEQALYEKPEIHEELRDGLLITVYYLRKLGTVSMALTFVDNIREFPIPNDEVNNAIVHPEAYANRAGLPRINTRRGTKE